MNCIKKNLVSGARRPLPALVDSIIRHRGYHGHDDANGFIPTLAAAAKNSCFFIELRRISLRSNNIGSK
jgi:hypothetical protein